jgi:hypothetical protein
MIKGTTPGTLQHRGGNVDVLEKLWEWAKEVLNTENLNNNLLLAKDNEGNTVFQHEKFSCIL